MKPTAITSFCVILVACAGPARLPLEAGITKVVFIPFGESQPSGMPIDVLTGFRVGEKYYGRPVGVQIARDGSLLVADDVGNTIRRGTAA